MTGVGNIGRGSVRRCVLAALVAICAVLVAAVSAQADSIVYIKGGDVWLANPDGSGQQRVTTDGSIVPYSSPSEDDNGVIAAHLGDGGVGTTLVRMRQDGHVLSSFNAAYDEYSGLTLDHVVKPVISYDGTKIAFGYFCYCGGGSLEIRGRWRAEFTRSDQPTDPNTFGHPYDFQEPTWVTNSRALMMGTPPGQASLFDIGASVYVPWFDDPVDSGGNSGSFSDGVVSRQGDKLALVYAKTTTSLRFYTVTGNVQSGPPPAPPTLNCAITANDPATASPSFSPSGSQLVFTDSSGVELAQIPASLTNNCAALTYRLLIPGASQARFSAASIVSPGPGPCTSNCGPGPCTSNCGPGPCTSNCAPGSNGKPTAAPRPDAYRGHCKRRHRRTLCVEPAPIKHLVYHGTTSDGQKLTTGLDGHGRYFLLATKGLRFRCADGTDTIEDNVSIISADRTTLSKHATVTTRLDYYPSGDSSHEVIYVVAAFDGPHARGALVGNIQIAGHGECTTGKITWTARA